MKKHWYYVIPFVVFPITSLLCIFLDSVEINFYICATCFVLPSLIIGNLSPTSKMFDYGIPAISVIAYNCCRFVCGFLAKTDLETRFSVYEAIEWVLVDTSLLISVLIAVTTFLASFKFIRITRATKKH